MPRKVRYWKSLFINCPFDAEYQPLFRSLIFAFEYCGFRARRSLESDDAGETRIGKIQRLIRDSQFGIHDLSRIESNQAGLPRFNMPFEFGLFLGFQWAGDQRQARKRTLVLVHEQYLYKQYLSDIAGQDVQYHDNRPEVLIRAVRSWLAGQSEKSLPFGGDYIVGKFGIFQRDLPEMLLRIRKNESDRESFPDYHALVCEWIRDNTD